jgi:hypothetical protein
MITFLLIDCRPLAVHDLLISTLDLFYSMLKFSELKDHITESILKIPIETLAKQFIHLIKTFTFVPLSGLALGACIALLQQLLDKESFHQRYSDLLEILESFKRLIHRRHCPFQQICDFLSVLATIHPTLIISSEIIPQLLTLELRYDAELVSGITSLTNFCLSSHQDQQCCESFVDYLVDSRLLWFLLTRDHLRKDSVINSIRHLINFNPKYLARIEMMGLPEDIMTVLKKIITPS